MTEYDARKLRWVPYRREVESEIRSIIEEADEPVSSGEIIACMDLDESSTHQHLRRMRDEGKVTYDRNWRGEYVYG